MIITDDMTIGEIIYRLNKEYGEDFNWITIPVTQSGGYFVTELKRELNDDDEFLRKKVWAAAKCTSNDDVLFFSEENIWRIYHLTYSSNKENVFPRYIEFSSRKSAAEYIQDQFIAEYL